MSDTYAKKINGNPIAASEVIPSSPLETKINGKVSKTGDTMTGRLTLEKPISQVITGTGTVATTSGSGSSTLYYPALWKFNLGIATPTAGDKICIRIPVAGHDYGVFISTDNGTTYFPVARHTGKSRLGTQYPNGAYICVVFEGAASGITNSGCVDSCFPPAGATARQNYTSGCWRVFNDYDSGNTVSQLRHENGRFYAGSTGCNPYALVCLDKDNKFSMLTSSGSGTGTSKTINTSGKFKLSPVILYYAANNTAAANARVSSTYATFNAITAIDTRYSHNHTTTFAVDSPLYIECTIDENGFWSPTTKCITQTLESGKYYIFLGLTYSTEYQLCLMPYHPLYYYDGTNLTEVPRLSKADRTKLDGIASGATKVESSSTNGKININGTDTTVYTHPTQTAYSAKGSATKVPKITTDSTGHITSIEEVTISGVAPASHTHGNIANGGTLTDTAAAAAGNDYVVIRDADNSKIQTSTIKGTDVADAVSKKHSHSTLTLSTTAQAYDGSHTLALPSSDPYTSARTPASHTHGNITNGGKLQANDITVASGDKLVVTDSSNYDLVARTSVSFDGSTTTKALTPKGTFESFAKAGDITTAIQALDVSSVGGDGKYISAISETDGKISATSTTMDITPTTSSTKAVTSGGVKTALDNKADKVSITGATKCKITYNSQGIVTAGDNLAESDIPTLNWNKMWNTTIAFHRDLGRGSESGDNKKWTKILSKTVTNYATNSVWGASTVIYDVYNNGYGSPNIPYIGTLELKLVWGHSAGSGHSLKTSGAKYARWIKWNGSFIATTDPLTASDRTGTSQTAGIYVKVLAVSDDTVEWWFYNNIWDTGVLLYPRYYSNAAPLPYSASNTKMSDEVIDYISTTGATVTNYTLGDGAFINYSLASNYPRGFTSYSTSQPNWGKLKDSTLYAPVTKWNVDDCEIVFAKDKTAPSGHPNKTLSLQIDGYFYQNEGNYRVLDTSDVTSTYSATGTSPVNGTAVASAISGKASSTHTHGNIANGGTLTDTAAAAAGNDYVVIRDADNAKIQTSTIKGTDVADAVSKKHSHSTLTLSTTAQKYDGSHTLALPSSDPYTSARTPASHTHGNIQNGGTLQTNDVTIASGDKLIVTDSSDSNKVARTSVSFDGSTTTKALTPKGTFEAFAKSGDITTAIQALDVSSVGGDGKYISAISEKDGKISATATTMDTTPTASSTKSVTSGGVKTALDGKVKKTTVTLLEDWNTLDTTGIYEVESQAKNVANSPESGKVACYVTVVDGYITQLAVGDRVRKRCMPATTQVWENWVVLQDSSGLTVNELYTTSPGGYIDIHGATIEAGGPAGTTEISGDGITTPKVNGIALGPLTDTAAAIPASPNDKLNDVTHLLVNGNRTLKLSEMVENKSYVFHIVSRGAVVSVYNDSSSAYTIRHRGSNIPVAKNSSALLNSSTDPAGEIWLARVGTNIYMSKSCEAGTVQDSLKWNGYSLSLGGTPTAGSGTIYFT